MRLLLFSVVAFSVIFLIGFIQSVTADHLELGTGLFVTESKTSLVASQNTNYQIHLQLVIRNGDGQLISVVESTANAGFIPHEITDRVFDTLMGKKEIVTIDNIKYEKVQYIFSPTLEYRFIGLYPIFSEANIEFVSERGTNVEDELYEENKVYSIWKIHYCATFKGHGFQCIPIFQVLVPTTTMEPQDVVTQQWTILRELN